jgi:putative ABC transport system permease protein
MALEQLVAVEASVPVGDAQSPGTAQLFRELGTTVARLEPSAKTAASEGGPFGARNGVSVRTPEMPDTAVGALQDEATGGPYYYAVDPTFFSTIGLRTIAGRTLDSTDSRGTPAVAVINESLARVLPLRRSALGACLLLGSESNCTTVVGIVADHAVAGVVEKPYRMIYLPLEQDEFSPIAVRTVFVRTTRPASTKRELEQGLASLRPRFQRLTIEPLADRVAPQVHAWRTGALVFVGFATCALLLTSFGVYGTVLHQLTLRRRELAVRKALGATFPQLARAAAGPVISSVLIGLAVGTIASAGAGQAVSAFLFGVKPTSLPLLGLAAGVVAATVAAALAWPLSRATGEGLLASLRGD